jgi:hypothetical protein
MTAEKVARKMLLDEDADVIRHLGWMDRIRTPRPARRSGVAALRSVGRLWGNGSGRRPADARQHKQKAQYASSATRRATPLNDTTPRVPYPREPHTSTSTVLDAATRTSAGSPLTTVVSTVTSWDGPRTRPYGSHNAKRRADPAGKRVGSTQPFDAFHAVRVAHADRGALPRDSNRVEPRRPDTAFRA